MKCKKVIKYVSDRVLKDNKKSSIYLFSNYILIDSTTVRLIKI